MMSVVVNNNIRIEMLCPVRLVFVSLHSKMTDRKPRNNRNLSQVRRRGMIKHVEFLDKLVEQEAQQELHTRDF